MYIILDKYSIMTEIVSFLSTPVHGPNPRRPCGDRQRRALRAQKWGATAYVAGLGTFYRRTVALQDGLRPLREMAQERGMEGLPGTASLKEQGEHRPFQRGFRRKPCHGHKRGRTGGVPRKEEAGASTDGPFVNGDAGSDSDGFRSACTKKGA